MTIPDLYAIYQRHPVISTDTRKIAPGSLFFALKGDKFDANTFAEKAIEAGAAYAVIDNPEYALDERYLLVEDGLTALQHLAAYHRSLLDIPVIALTGSNGKTTTKELINAVLSQRYKTLATIGNLNNHIGVPLTLLSISTAHEMAIVEMGANHQKEIAFLCTIAQPTHGLITNVGKAHLEGFGGVEGVKKGKGEMYDYLVNMQPEDTTDNRRIAFINSDDAILLSMQQERGLTNAIYYGKNDDERNLISGKLVDNSPFLVVDWKDKFCGESFTIASNLTGAYNIDNILVAICIGATFGMSTAEINDGIAGYHPTNNRSQIVQTATNTLICDLYNANPSSMFVAIDNLDKMAAARKVLILGDMFEMGEESAEEHTAVIKKALDADVQERIFIGQDFASQQTEVNGAGITSSTFYLTAEDAIAGLKSNPVTNATVLIKGSRGMALERLITLL
ncbi:UDP-N-acetylmuramoyl-tripeptide--D-alanyl-D-alanine ligase [Mucilaginibacter terrenus]|uniref:UDP-N-acetylmuramoyl-tripeptide--D-alanyl-D-alanine ligase n=1 Tax=Mucilaginibacter terrenus TaxID=2482727 RepID=A0A3E2NRF7_9SPHI|nr:UDP-N-acetylmuramoyl-tripeptide--D-alanyl-D-alanine ligase [Mucilaginibacter terrenus]